MEIHDSDFKKVQLFGELRYNQNFMQVLKNIGKVCIYNKKLRLEQDSLGGTAGVWSPARTVSLEIWLQRIPLLKSITTQCFNKCLWVYFNFYEQFTCYSFSVFLFSVKNLQRQEQKRIMSSPSAGKRRMDTDVIKLYPLQIIFSNSYLSGGYSNIYIY